MTHRATTWYRRQPPANSWDRPMRKKLMKMWKTRMVNMGKTLYMIPTNRMLWYYPNMVSISIPTIIFDSTSIYANSQNVDLTLHALPHLRRGSVHAPSQSQMHPEERNCTRLTRIQHDNYHDTANNMTQCVCNVHTAGEDALKTRRGLVLAALP